MRNNPFADFGRPVGGDRFVGREKALRTIQARVIEPSQPGNLALVGEPRIGKSSIAHNAIRHRRCDLLDRRRVPVWLNVGLFKNGWEIFQQLVRAVVQEIETQGWLTTDIDRLAKTVAAFDGLSGESQVKVLEFFAAVRKRDVVVIAVLDEFDNADRLWSSDRPGFQLLRELSHDPASAIGLVTTSRRELSDIERSSGVISTLAGTFMKVYVQPFEEAEAKSVLDRLEASGLRLNESEREAIWTTTGWHPLFLDMACFYLLEAQLSGRDSTAVILQDAPEQFIEIYQQHRAQMEKDGSLAKLLQVLFGPVMDVTSFDVDRFLRHGIVRVVGDGYRAYSEHFEGYLRSVSRQADPWPLWRDTEQAIRRCVGSYLADQYGSPWREGLCRARPKMVDIVEGWETARRKEENRYGASASTSLLDYSYPQEVFGIIRSDWAWFKNIFQGQTSDWEPRFQTLSKVRTPLAHNRVPDSYRGIVDEATGICRQLLDRISAWERAAQATS